jgi:hypothetical protein
MDLSKLDQNERLAFGAAVVVFVAGVLSFWGGLLFLSVLAAVGVVLVLFASNATLPGSRGSLLTILGVVALAAAVIELVVWVGYTLDTLGRFGTILFIVVLVASAVMAWAGWQVLQREGGKFQLGMTTATPAPAAAAADAPAPAAAEPAPVADAREPEATDTGYDPDDYRPREG